MAITAWQCWPRLAIWALVARILGGWLALAHTQPPAPGQGVQPKPLDEKVVKAWEAAGAQVGRLGESVPGGIVAFAFTSLAAKPGDLPAFMLPNWMDGIVSKLPDPGQPFGLLPCGANLANAELKELAGLKSLQTLGLNSSSVTDVGLKQLVGLKSLQRLILSDTNVTDAGLKELAGLKSLQSLDLDSTKVTDAGLKELAGLKNLQTLDLFNTNVTGAGLKELAGLFPALSSRRYWKLARPGRSSTRWSPDSGPPGCAMRWPTTWPTRSESCPRANVTSGASTRWKPRWRNPLPGSKAG